MGDKPSLEKMVTLTQLQSVFENKKVLLTGHTGFKGSWMLQILALCQADIVGYSLAPEEKSLYRMIKGDALCHSIIHDLRDAAKVKEVILHHQPDFIFHLAAQPLVLDSYDRPLYTFEVNTQGTAHVLDALRFMEKPCTAIMITTDKVYENKDLGTLFKEEDKLGGYDPYSASKAACEIVIQSYTYSFFNRKKIQEHKKNIVSVRAGNVIGGGDFSANRIIPDIIQAVQKNEAVILRNPLAIRPWQHVLEPVVAYLNLAYQCVMHREKVGEAYNIGPEKEDALTVEELTQIALQSIGNGSYEVREDKNKPHEAGILMLDIQKIKNELGWHPVYSAKQAIEKTVSWYISEEDASKKCLFQIHEYFNHTVQNA